MGVCIEGIRAWVVRITRFFSSPIDSQVDTHKVEMRIVMAAVCLNYTTVIVDDEVSSNIIRLSLSRARGTLKTGAKIYASFSKERKKERKKDRERERERVILSGTVIETK